MTYQVRKLNQPFTLDGNWDKEVWKEVPALEIKNYMGAKPEHRPLTQAKLLYDDDYVYVIFRVEDRYVRAGARKYQDMVCEDSCVEFFFTPSDDIKQGYFNVEVNAGGTMLLYHQLGRGLSAKPVAAADGDRIEICHSLPEIIDSEITEPTNWTIEYRIPFEVIEKYAPCTRGGPGVTWWANFYKCADKTSHPHWLTWSVVDNPTPDFHRPEFFGTLEFR